MLNRSALCGLVLASGSLAAYADEPIVPPAPEKSVLPVSPYTGKPDFTPNGELVPTPAAATEQAPVPQNPLRANPSGSQFHPLPALMNGGGVPPAPAPTPASEPAGAVMAPRIPGGYVPVPGNGRVIYPVDAPTNYLYQPAPGTIAHSPAQYNAFSTSGYPALPTSFSTSVGMHDRYPYYSYRRPWYTPGPISHNVNIIW
ncbi:hypothetical protein [Planctomicrobium sp. SH527]|uniref:hypothetical protein n=1 Tax=Planctomicrobium sp. SH527 TaxID=3448123 RepID=UPI003F5C73F3